MCVTIGSVTLLKWKLLATPQLGGASSYFSNISHPGVHVKSWRGSPKNEKVVTHDNSNITNSNNSSRTIGEEELGTSVDYSPSSTPSTATTTVTSAHSPTLLSTSSPQPAGNHGDHKRVTGIYSRVKTTNSSKINNVTGMNDISGLLLDTNNNNNNIVLTLPSSSDTVPHHSGVGNSVTSRMNPLLQMRWLPGVRQAIATERIGLSSLIDDKVD